MQSPFSQLSDTLFVSPQIQVDDIIHIIHLGIKTVICHRPDEELSPEEYDNIGFSMLQKRLEDKGVNLIYQPISQIVSAEVEQLNDLLNTHDTPTLMYCLSGTRSALLWALSEIHINQRDRQAVIDAAEQAGYAIGNYL